MSYSIIYDKQFISLPNGSYVPMILSGDSNVYERPYRGVKMRRSRDWQNYTHILRGRKYGSLKDMLDKAEYDRKSSYESEKAYREKGNEPEISEKEFNEKYGWYTAIAVGSKHTSETTYAMYEGIFKTGVKKALDVEQLRGVGIYVYAYTSRYEIEELASKGIEPFKTYVNTSAELQQLINEKAALFAEKDAKADFRIGMDASELSIKKLRQKFFPVATTIKKEINPNDFYVLQSDKGFYFNKNTKFGYKYSYSENGAKKFETEKAAEKTLRRINAVNHGFEIRHVKRPIFAASEQF